MLPKFNNQTKQITMKREKLKETLNQSKLHSYPPEGYEWIKSIPDQHFDTLKLYISIVMDDGTIEDISTKSQLAIAFSKDQGQSYGEYHRKCFENIMRLGYTTEQEIMMGGNS